MYTSRDITIAVGTSGQRLATEFPACLLSAAMQDPPPRKVLVIFDTPEFIDIRPRPEYQKTLQLLADRNIEFEAVFAERAPVGIPGVRQLMQRWSKTEIIFRIDDDHVLATDCLRYIIGAFNSDKGGAYPCAVGVTVINPGVITPTLPPTGKILNLMLEDNLQWCSALPKERTHTVVEHLHGAFAYRTALVDPSCFLKDLSKAGHREETYFSYKLFRKTGFPLVVAHQARVFHFHAAGGTRSFSGDAFDNDEAVFQKQMQEEFQIRFTSFQDGSSTKLSPLVILDNGLGDHIVFRNTILPHLRKKYDIVQIACPFTHVFEKESSVRLVSIEEAKKKCTPEYVERCNLYKYLADHQQIPKTLEQGYREIYESLFNITL